MIAWDRGGNWGVIDYGIRERCIPVDSTENNEIESCRILKTYSPFQDDGVSMLWAPK